MRLRGLAAKRVNLGERKLLITAASAGAGVGVCFRSLVVVLLGPVHAESPENKGSGLNGRPEDKEYEVERRWQDYRLQRTAGCLASWLSAVMALQRLVIRCKCQAKPKRLTVARNLDSIQPSVSTMSLMHPPRGQHRLPMASTGLTLSCLMTSATR